MNKDRDFSLSTTKTRLELETLSIFELSANSFPEYQSATSLPEKALYLDPLTAFTSSI